jgi:fumarate hydratase subunit alpha
LREIHVDTVRETVARLCQEANFYLPEDAVRALKIAREREESPSGVEILRQLLDNAEIATREHIPLCQDCGIVVVHLSLGQDVHIVGGELYDAVEKGVAQGYTKGYLRASMVRRPFSARINTGDNTPPIVRYEIVPGDKLTISVMPKGEGAENGSRVGMLEPAAGRKGVVDFVVETVESGGSSVCPPLVVGVGVGGTAGRVMWLAKKALLRPIGQPNPDREVADLEREILDKVNALGIGPQGLGGVITALAVHVEALPCPIAALPVAVNPECHCARHKEAVI